MVGPTWSNGVKMWRVCLLMVMVKWVSCDFQADALYELKNSLIDPHQVLNSWDPTLVTPCTWFHVTCDDSDHVIRVDLGDLNLFGNLVPDLGKLEYLQYLVIYTNNIQGNIPPELGNLKNLISLDLSHNQISGTIPPELGNLKSLLFLRLNDNNLTGKVPTELNQLPKLRVKNLSGNPLDPSGDLREQPSTGMSGTA